MNSLPASAPPFPCDSVLYRALACEAFAFYCPEHARAWAATQRSYDSLNALKEEDPKYRAEMLDNFAVMTGGPYKSNYAKNKVLHLAATCYPDLFDELYPAYEHIPARVRLYITQMKMKQSRLVLEAWAREHKKLVRLLKKSESSESSEENPTA